MAAVYSLYSPMWALFTFLGAVAFVNCAGLGRLADGPSQAERSPNSIDGLRGFLATAVFIHHAAIYEEFLRIGDWRLPHSDFYVLCGQGGVAFFFLVTAYLFWGRLTQSKIAPASFLIGRIYRVGPLYLAAFVPVLVVSLLLGEGEHPLEQLKHVVRWLALGAWGSPAINGYNSSHLLAGVTWSLQYEWAFYAAIVVLALIRVRSLLVPVGALVLAVALTLLQPADGPTPQAGLLLFAMGALCVNVAPKPPSMAGALSVIVTIGVLFAFFNTAYGVLPILLASLAFALIVQGENLFGLLTSRAAIRLGNISYGVYLLQGLVLAGVFAVPPVRSFALNGPGHYWIVIVGAAFVLVTVSTFAHAFVEQPGIAAGKRLIDRMGAPRRARLASSQ